MERVDVFVIGGGGTGSDVTHALSEAGLTVAMAERERLGGECTHFGCDPSKAMLKSARVAALARRASEFGVRIDGDVLVDFEAVRDRVRRLIEEETSAGASAYEERGARIFLQEARLAGERRVELSDGTAFEADRIVLTTGSLATAPPVRGLQDGEYWTNKEAIWHEGGVPRTLLILGAGAIGVEFAQIYSRFGSKVTLAEASDQVLPGEERDSSRVIRDALSAEGIEVRTGAKAVLAERWDGRWELDFEGRDAVEADELLVATGRRPCFDGHDLEAAGIRVDEAGRPVLTDTLRTTAGHIWAGGDATGDLLFTHVGDYEAGVIVADILGRPFPRDYRVVPRVTFCEPEVAGVGLTEDEAREAGHEVTVGFERFAHNSRAVLDGETEGHVKLVADARTGEILGGHIVGANAGELIHEVVVAMAGRVELRAIANAVHAYPTLSQAVRNAFRQLGSD